MLHRSSVSADSDVFRRTSVLSRTSALSSTSTARAERQPLLLSGAPPPQVFAHPVECASLTNRVLFQWVTPSVTLANHGLSQNQTQTQTQSLPYQIQQPHSVPTAKRGLQQADVWELPPHARAEAGANALQRAWITRGSLPLAFVSTHGLQFAGLGVLDAIVQLCDLMGPYVLFQMVSLLQQQEQQHEDEAETRSSLLFWLGTLLVSRLLRALLSTFARAELQTMTLRLTIALQSLVFQKALRLPSVSTREVDTLGTVDVMQLLQGVACVHELWAMPFVVVLIVAVIASFIGVAACVATVVLAVGMLLVSRLLTQLQLRSLDRLRKTREDRQKSVIGTVHALPAVKLHAWEPAAGIRVKVTGGREFAALWNFHVRCAAEIAFSFATPVLVTTAALGVAHHSSAHSLTAASAFATLALVRLMQTPLRVLPKAVVGARNAWRSLCRLSHFIDQDELDPHAVARRDSLGVTAKYDERDVVIAVEDATLVWGSGGPVLFQHLDLTVSAGELLLVHGRPGSGKSSFLSALLGEMQARDRSDGGGGRVYVGGSVAYCPQQPWLQQTLSVRENVLFGLPFDRRKYQLVLDACALANSLAVLSTGDRTLIQEWMPTPGQQALVSLARACYSDAAVYLLDEPLARCSEFVAREVFDRCLSGLLRNKTRVVVTTRKEFVNSEFVDDAIRFEDGGRLMPTRDMYEGKEREEQAEDKGRSEESENVDVDRCAHYSASGLDFSSINEPRGSRLEGLASAEQLSIENAVNTTRTSLSERPLREYFLCETAAEAEWGEIESERMGKSIRAYAHAIGGARAAVALVALLLFWQALQLLSEVYVAYWVRSSSHTSMAADQLIYASLALGGTFIAFGYALAIAVVAVGGMRRAFLSLAFAFLQAPLAFFDAFGCGNGRVRSKRLSLARRRKLERAFTGTDLTDMGVRLPLAVGAILVLGASTLTALLTTATVTQYYVVLIAPVLYVYVRTARLYLRPARDLFHLGRLARQAAQLHVTESLLGARVLRAFGPVHVNRVLGHHFWLQDVAARNSHLGLHIDQWLTLRIQLYGAVIVGIVASSTILALRHTLSTGTLALALYEALVVDGGALESLVRVWIWLGPVLPIAARTQAAVRGAKAITESTAHSTAAASRTSGPFIPVQSVANPSLSWPTKGDVRFDAVSFRDPAAANVEITDIFEAGDGGAPPLALRCVSFRLLAGEKVAVFESSGVVSSVGRALLRVHEPTAGRIVVDGVDMSTLDVHTLRSRVACVSAAAPSGALYDGSVRTQLDPSGADIGDERLWTALHAVGLASNVATLDGLLPGIAALQQNPANRLRLSLARALLSEPSVVVLALAPVLLLSPEDEFQLQLEPYASLDDATLEVLQRVMHKELCDATVLLLLPSAAASPQSVQAQITALLSAVSRVLVVGNGEIAELGTPADLATTAACPGQQEILPKVLSRLELSDLEHFREDSDPVASQRNERLEHHVSSGDSATRDEALTDTANNAVR
uniref:ABC transporter n=1 Tax=Peronospora matthiolae TaxID=2874970 RepID=A0AAV1TKD0_9STRA